MLKTNAWSAHWSSFSNSCHGVKGCCSLFLQSAGFTKGRVMKVTQHADPPFNDIAADFGPKRGWSAPVWKWGKAITIQAHMMEGMQSIKGVVSRTKWKKFKRTPFGFVFCWGLTWRLLTKNLFDLESFFTAENKCKEQNIHLNYFSLFLSPAPGEWTIQTLILEIRKLQNFQFPITFWKCNCVLCFEVPFYPHF